MTPVAASAGIPGPGARPGRGPRVQRRGGHPRDGLEREGDTIAAVILEPVFHNPGVVLPEPGFLETLREACTAAGVVLIFDEIITGFRHAPGGAQERFGVTPDLSTFGKAIGNGFPISVLWRSRRTSTGAASGPKGDVLFAGTFAGHTLDCRRGAGGDPGAVLEGEIHRHLVALGRRLTTGIQAAIDATGARVRLRESGGVWTMYFTDAPIRRFRDFARFAMDKDHPIQRGLPRLAARARDLHPPALHDPGLPDRRAHRGRRRPAGRGDGRFPRREQGAAGEGGAEGCSTPGSGA